MATYKEIKGVTIQTRAQDPALAILPNPNLYPYLAVFK